MGESVDRATSSPSLPGTVTRRRLPPTTPRKWRWLPFHRLRRNPWSVRTRTTSRTFILGGPHALHRSSGSACSCVGKSTPPGGNSPPTRGDCHQYRHHVHVSIHARFDPRGGGPFANAQDQQHSTSVVYVVGESPPVFQYTSPSAARNVGSSDLSPTCSSYRSRFSSSTNCRSKSASRITRASPVAMSASR